MLRPPTGPGRPARLVGLQRTRLDREWNAGKVGRYDPRDEAWREWTSRANPMIYAVYVDERDKVWLTDFGANALWRFDPSTSTFDKVELPTKKRSTISIWAVKRSGSITISGLPPLL